MTILRNFLGDNACNFVPVKRFYIALSVVFLVFSAGSQSSPITVPADPLSPMAKLFASGLHKSLFPVDSDGKLWSAIQTKQKESFNKYNPSSHYGDILYFRLLPEETLLLLAEPGIEFADVFGILNAPRPLNDTARIHSFVNQVHDGLNNGLPASFKGNGVVAGIVDIGFQTNHPTFYNADGTEFRLKRFWHQNTTLGAKPAGYSYGSEFTQPGDLKAIRDDDGTHGTHVAGIMAGSGFTTPQLKYRGMAPEADLVFVTIKYANDSLQGSAYGDYIVANPTILDGYKYIFDYAKSVGKPAVTNLSWGMHTGPHDGTSLFDKSVDQIAGAGKILVGANGNDAGNQMHITGTLKGDTAFTFAVDRSRKDYPKENIYCDFWGPQNEVMGLNISVFDTLGNLKHTEPFLYSNSGNLFRKIVPVGSEDTLIYSVISQSKYVNNNKPNILLMAEMSNSALHRLRIGITTRGVFHGWNSGQTYRWTSGAFLDEVKGNSKKGEYLAGTAAGSMSENGGTGKRTISTGSYINRKEWIDYKGVYRAQNWLTVGEISGFSGRGPTPDGRMKPDISAPGQMVASAVNNKQFAGWMGDVTTYTSQFNGETQYWTMFSGTSMASPHAAGIIALMLQACPTLTPEQVRYILSKTSKRDALTGPDSNNSFGYGRINAFEAVKVALSIHNAKTRLWNGMSEMLIFPVPAQNSLVFSSEQLRLKTASVEFYEVGGKKVKQTQLLFNTNGECEVDLKDLSSGVYSYKLASGDWNVRGKFSVQH